MRLALLGIFAGLLALAESKTAPAPVVVELFTSEGCSSCPPADEVLAKVEGRDAATGAEVIALGEHVTYWDRLGWKDRFSQDVFTERQEAYSQHFRLSSVYTPQMVVNGQVELLGSDQSRLRKEIARAGSQQAVKIELTEAGGKLSYRMTGLPLGARGAEVMLAVTESRIETNVKKGENSGRNLRHTGVVRSLMPVGRVTEISSQGFAGDTKLPIAPNWQRENLKYVVFLQDPVTRRIWGAAALKL